LRDGVGAFACSVPSGGLREDHRLAVFRVVRTGQQKARGLRRTERPGERAFEDAALLRRLGGGERVARVERCIAEPHVEGAGVVTAARPGDDLDPAAARPHELGGVRILLILICLHRRRGDRERVHLHAVDEDRRAAGADGRRVEEAHHRADDVLIEHWKTVERVGVHGDSR